MAQSKLNPGIAQLNENGQSIWYDNLSRDVLNSGELAGLVEQGVSGLTSNPAIFKAAIADSNTYDSRMIELSHQGLNAEAVCEELMVEDVGRAADLLRPVFDHSRGSDGYVSIEVSPDLARETEKTIDAAKRIHSKLSRPNVMIKVPATPEGLPAIRALLEDGICVNVTLIFSEAVYRRVMDTYISALETRFARRQDLSCVASVASFFVSRVDSICEKKLSELVTSGKVPAQNAQTLSGRLGIANSVLAYSAFQEVFSSDRFERLESAGARLQRPLWASTGTKNPAFSPVLYVEELVGPHTVNTVPPATLKALMSGLRVEEKLEKNLGQAHESLRLVKEYLPFDSLLVELQEQGVKLFADANTALLSSIQGKLAKLS